MPIYRSELSLIIPKPLVLELRNNFREAKIILEAHDALLFAVRIDTVNDFIPIAKKEMERPINFTACSLPRRFLKIPCEVEVGENYKDLKKFKGTDEPVRIEPIREVVARPLTPTEEFTVTSEEEREEYYRKLDEVKDTRSQ